MQAQRAGGTITLTMTVKEAADLTNELLWGAREDDQALKAAYDMLSDLDLSHLVETSEGEPS